MDALLISKQVARTSNTQKDALSKIDESHGLNYEKRTKVDKLLNHIPYMY